MRRQRWRSVWKCVHQTVCEKDCITLKLEVTTINDHKRQALTPPLEQVTPVMG
jgi:hypothetical protein